MSEDYVPTIPQQKLLGGLMMSSALLSMIGSSVIIHNVLFHGRDTPYRRLMLGLSISDVIWSFGYLLQPVLLPQDHVTPWVWAVGNSATCNFLGAITQFGFASHWYSGVLSFYFLFTAKYGMRQTVFEKYERWIHCFIFTWSITTTVVGAVLHVFHQQAIGPGCWVNDYPEGCFENDQVDCTAHIIAWIFGGIPSILMLICVIVNNVILYRYVRATIAEGQKRSLRVEKDLSNYGEEDDSGDEASVVTKKSIFTMGSIFRKRNPSSVLRSSDKQWKRVREVGTQSLFYVSAYLLAFTWGYALNILASVNYHSNPGSGSLLFPLLVLQSIFLPSQGFSNALIFFRPKYLQARTQFPAETRTWYIRRSLFGEAIKPVKGSVTPQISSSSKAKPVAPTSAVRINYSGHFISSMGSLGTINEGNDLLGDPNQAVDELATYGVGNTGSQISSGSNMKAVAPSSAVRINHSGYLVSSMGSLGTTTGDGNDLLMRPDQPADEQAANGVGAANP